jgi:RNA polymerase sigma-70 factor (ECF subfamily)
MRVHDGQLALGYPAWGGLLGPEAGSAARASRAQDHMDQTPEPRPDSTSQLLGRARDGDRRAYDALYSRYAVRLRRWASGRMPDHVRDGMETADIVQDAFIRVFRQIDQLELRQSGGLYAYLRQSVLNRIRDQIRRAGVRDRVLDEVGPLLAASPSPLSRVIGREALERYESALARLPAADREAVVARLELDCSYEEIADVLGKPSADAARMSVKRALARMAREMEAVGDVST